MSVYFVFINPVELLGELICTSVHVLAYKCCVLYKEVLVVQGSLCITCHDNIGML